MEVRVLAIRVKTPTLSHKTRQRWDTLRVTLERLLVCQPRRSHFQSSVRGRDCGCMAQESTNGKDNLRVEKLSLLVLTLCIVVLVYVLAARPF